MTKSKGNCAFCQNEIAGSKSKEHIIPRWLLKELGINEEIITPTHFSVENGLKPVSTRTHDLNSLVSRVCVNCNTGWMADLENEARPLLIPLIRCEKSVIDMNDKERFVIARWAFKTALTLNLGSNFHKNISLSHYTFIYDNEDKLPEGVCVVAQQHNSNRTFYWLQGALWHVIGVDEDDLDKEKLKNKSYKVGFQFDGLILLVGFNPLLELLFKIDGGIHVPMYPIRGPKKISLGNDFNFDDSEEAFYRFFWGLGLSAND